MHVSKTIKGNQHYRIPRFELSEGKCSGGVSRATVSHSLLREVGSVNGTDNS